MTDQYTYWAAKLRGEDITSIVDQPECGFYRTRRGTSWVPVAVWPKGNGLQGPDALGFKIGTEVVGANMGTELWSHYCAHPITEAEYRKVAEQGGDWSDSDPTVNAIINAVTLKKEITPKQIANKINSGERLDPEESARLELAFIEYDNERNAGPLVQFREQIATAAAGLAAYQTIESDEAAARAAGLRNLLLKLKKDADDQRAALKAPHLKAGQEIDAAWNPLVKEAGAAADKIRNAIGSWETLKRQAAAQAAQRDAEAARAAEAAGRPTPAPVVPNAPAPSQQVRPTFGKAAGVSVYQHVVKIDPDKVLAALRTRPEWYGVLQYLEEACQRLARNGVILDGVTTEERAKVR